MMAPLEFCGGQHLPEVKTPETLLKSARDWLDLVAQDYMAAGDALRRGDKAEAVARIKAAESKSYQARQDLAEAIAVEAGAL